MENTSTYEAVLARIAVVVASSEINAILSNNGDNFSVMVSNSGDKPMTILYETFKDTDDDLFLLARCEGVVAVVNYLVKHSGR